MAEHRKYDSRMQNFNIMACIFEYCCPQRKYENNSFGTENLRTHMRAYAFRCACHCIYAGPPAAGSFYLCVTELDLDFRFKSGGS